MDRMNGKNRSGVLGERLSRGQFLRRAGVGGGLLVVSGGVLAGCGEQGGAQSTTTQSGDSTQMSQGGTTSIQDGQGKFAAQVDDGLEYFQSRADDQLPLAESLLSAIESGDMQRARTAYVEARPPYEEIEVLAANFEQTDSDIDARPYSFDEGEASEDFKGFHRIEGLLYREEDLEAALPYAEGLVESVKALQQDLRKRENFSAKTHFEGMIGLATEVPAKKISSEEETYSDQSLLIFRHNWEGIYSQFEPFLGQVENRDAEDAASVTDAYERAVSTVEPYFDSGSVAAQPYSSVGIAKRGEIVRAGQGFRDSLIRASNSLGLA